MPDTSYDLKWLKYYMLCFVYEVSKFIIMLVLFTYLHLNTEYLVTILVLCTLRHNIGGIHFKHYWSCFAFSLFFIAGIIVCSKLVIVNNFIQIFTIVLCMIFTFSIGPIQAETRPPLDEKHFILYRNTACIILLLFLILFICMKSFAYRNLTYWVIVFQTLQLIAAKITGRRGENETFQ
ncbi:MAG: accessory gene regulator B family protein [Lachnospiraceae bacterium]|nr:accessory gene regulator B family protein [Lachnospiraceae bacterium]